MVRHAIGHVACYVRAGDVGEARRVKTAVKVAVACERGNTIDLTDVEGETWKKDCCLLVAHWLKDDL